ncbi:MAG: folylpolyglutamate synthase/dihydrofolate synthase family protein [Bacteroidota bacterium]
MDLNSALEKIYSMHQFTVKLGLERIESLLAYIGNPHRGLKYFHIAGSNGKGSTASFIASILMEAGFKVGLYTSPHLVKFNERIRINKVMIEDEYIANFINDVNDFIDRHEPTFFEITTALAFKYFKENNVDYVVLETGLGGRLDATNVIDPLASVITSISLEHTNILGNELETIAKEKAGIVKPNGDVLIGLVPDVAESVIREKAGELNCKFFPIKEYAKFHSDHIQLQLQNKVYNIYQTGLAGYHQLCNAALAVQTINRVLSIDDAGVINRGLINVVNNSGIQCRYETVSENPKIIFDAAHNMEGVEVFIDQFRKEADNYDERILIFGAMKDKDIEGMLGLLKGIFTEIYVTEIKNERAALYNDYDLAAIKTGIEPAHIDNPGLLIKEFQAKIGKKCLVVLGSIYLLGEIKTKLK